MKTFARLLSLSLDSKALQALTLSLSLLSFEACSNYNMSQPKSSSNGQVDEVMIMQRSAQVAFREAMESLSDSSPQGLRSPQARLQLAFSLQDVVDQTCLEKDGGAVITTKASQSSSIKFDSPEKNTSKDIFINSEIARSYTMAKEKLECARKLPIIEVDLDKELLGLQLDVTATREEKTYLSELVKPSTQNSPDSAKSTEPSTASKTPDPATPAADKAPASTTSTTSTDATIPVADPGRQMTSITASTTGSRKVTFTAQNKESNDLVSYNKDSVGKANRVETIQTSAAGDNSMSFAIESNFKIVDSYNEKLHDKAVGMGAVIKEITTGSVKAVRPDGSSVETTFKGLKLDFTSGACQATGGTVSTKFFASGTTTPIRTIDFDVASGSVSVTVSKLDPMGATPEAAQSDILSSMDIQKELCGMADFRD